MAFIELPDVPDVDGEAAEMFAADQRALGYVANLTRLFALRPAVYQAWQQLSQAVSQALTVGRPIAAPPAGGAGAPVAPRPLPRGSPDTGARARPVR
jgi:hypothetical protein